MSLRPRSPKSFEEMCRKEEERIEKRRIKAGREPGNPSTDAVGLGLSGGGIRSATFNLGLIQALHKNRALEKIDYLSTVSGGGYIGSSLTWLTARVPSVFPYGSSRKDHSGIGGKVLAWLRAHGSYMTPGDGMTLWSLLAAVITGTLVNLAILLPLFLLVFYILSRKLLIQGLFFEGFSLILAAAAGLGMVFLSLVIVFVLSTRFQGLRNYAWQRRLRTIAGDAVMWAVLLTLLGTLPMVYHLLVDKVIGWIWVKMSAISLFGVFSIMGGMHTRTTGNETKGMTSFLLSAGLGLLVYGIFLWFYHLTRGQTPIVGFDTLAVLLAISFVLAFTANINQVSMHRFYRNRLMEAYMPFSIKEAAPKGQPPQYYPYAEETDMDACFLKDIPTTAYPYHIINTNLQTVGSKNPKLNRRGGENFIFSPEYVGSAHTDWVKTGTYMAGTTNLATAMAISGAAVDPNSYATRSRPLSFLMSLLNIRLGCWVRNPRHKAMEAPLGHPMWYYYIFKEMFGRGLDENCWEIHLSDGGHFENLGLYELVRRQCPYIIISDAAADPDWTFTDLAKVIEMVRVDFGAQVEIDIEALKPQGEEGFSPAPFVKGTITYEKKENRPSQAELIYVKTSMIKGLSEDINAYARKNPSFPDQTTADQFFNERQFEAYRELGFLIGQKIGDLSGWAKNTSPQP